MYHANSISALKPPFTRPPPNSEQEGQGCSNKKNVHCHITKKKSQNIIHMRNGIEYCSVEVTCEKGSQYGIQA
jgi:hypothetical protein